MDSQSIRRLNAVVDKLTLESLLLMEQHISAKVELEKCMIDGEAHLAKVRYILGQRQVSQHQLPNENSTEFSAMAVVNQDKSSDVIKSDCFDLEYRKVNRTNGTRDIVNPIIWFGVLVPQSLHHAQEKFKQTLFWSVKGVNIQQKLTGGLKLISKLNKILSDKCSTHITTVSNN